MHWKCPSRRTFPSDFWYLDAWLYCPWAQLSTCSSLLVYHPFSVPTHGKSYDLQTKPNWSSHLVWWTLLAMITAYLSYTSQLTLIQSWPAISIPEGELTPSPPVKMDLAYLQCLHSCQELSQWMAQFWSMRHGRNLSVKFLGMISFLLWND